MGLWEDGAAGPEGAGMGGLRAAVAGAGLRAQKPLPADPSQLHGWDPFHGSEFPQSQHPALLEFLHGLQGQRVLCSQTPQAAEWVLWAIRVDASTHPKFS